MWIFHFFDVQKKTKTPNKQTENNDAAEMMQGCFVLKATWFVLLTLEIAWVGWSLDDPSKSDGVNFNELHGKETPKRLVFGKRLDSIFLVNSADSWRKRLASLLVEMSQGFNQSQLVNGERGCELSNEQTCCGIRIPSYMRSKKSHGIRIRHGNQPGFHLECNMFFFFVTLWDFDKVDFTSKILLRRCRCFTSSRRGASKRWRKIFLPFFHSNFWWKRR